MTDLCKNSKYAGMVEILAFVGSDHFFLFPRLALNVMDYNFDSLTAKIENTYATVLNVQGE